MDAARKENTGWAADQGSANHEVLRFEPFVVAAAYGDQIIDVGGAMVAAPFLDVLEFASMHGGAAFVASPDPYGTARRWGALPSCWFSS